MDEQVTDPPRQPKALVDEKDMIDKATTPSSVSAPPAQGAPTSATSIASSTAQPTRSPAVSPPISPPLSGGLRKPPQTAEDYYATRTKTDKLGNPIPERRRPSAMSSVFGSSSVRLPGDLGAKDPRRPKSPAPQTLPGDLGPNDPRRPRSASRNASPAPALHHTRTRSDEIPEPAEGERLMKDPKEPVPEASQRHSGTDDTVAEGDNDTDLEADDTERGRGRKRPEPGKTTAGKSINVRDESEDSEREDVASSRNWPGGAKPDPTKGESKASVLGTGTPEVTITPAPTKKRVHPSTAFDNFVPSGSATPLGGSDEETTRSELRAAQQLSLTMSNIHSTPSAHRVIRQIIRGDYAHFQLEAEEGRRRQRMYLVATDTSPESEHALEWTIGTVLRDGDTLFAVYAMTDDTLAAGGSVEIGTGADMVKDTAAIVRGLTSTTSVPTNSSVVSPLARAGLAGNSGGETRSRSRGDAVFSPAEQERRRALEDTTNRVVRLLRKTRLQVRVVVEVFHCKSPRHMITEVS